MRVLCLLLIVVLAGCNENLRYDPSGVNQIIRESQQQMEIDQLRFDMDMQRIRDW